MSDWPAQADYRDALQNVATALRTDVLGVCADGEVERNKMKVPRARAGAFASVYKLICPRGGATALKLFNFPSPDRQRRYQAVVDHLKKLGPKAPPGLVKFHYEAEGINVRIRGQRLAFPVQTMDWVKGVSLGEWVRETMAKKDHKAVRVMAGLWAKLVAGLQDAKIAHGDLQHDNVMVVNNTPVLVDYDGMVTPALEGIDQLEFGKPAYQHPKRGEQLLSLGIDHFSAWIILIALRASAAAPGLYDRFVTRTENENLLFSPEDLQNPASSELWPVLTAFPHDPDVAGWAKELRASLDKPFSSIPPFALDPTAGLRAAKEWGAVAAEADRLERAGKPVPADLAARVAEARKRVAVRDRVQAAVLKNDPRAVVAAYDPTALAGWPEAAPLRDAADRARLQVTQLDALKAAAAAPGDGRALVAAWDRAAAALAGVPEADGYKRAADGWRGRIRAADDFRRADTATATEQAVADAWQAVVKAGPPHPSLTPADRVRGEEAGRRAAALNQLRKLPTGVSEAADRALTAAWAAVKLDGCREAKPFADRVPGAAARLKAVEAVGRAVQAADRGGSEEAVKAAAAALPAGYDHAHSDRVRVAVDAVKYDGELRRLLAESPQSDLKIAAAWTALKTTRPIAATVAPRDTIDRCDLAVRRTAALRELGVIDKSDKSVERQDHRWYEGWKRHQSTLTGCDDAGWAKARATLAYRRLKMWSELSKALETEDLSVVRKLAAEPDLAGYPPLVRCKGKLDELVRRGAQVEAILQKLRGGGAPLAATDLAFLRDHADLFGPESRARVVKEVEQRLQTRARLAPGRPPHEPYQPGPATAPLLMVRWDWAEQGLVSSCKLAFDPARHLTTPDQAGPYATSEVRPEDFKRNGGGAYLPWPGKLYVTVWPMVQLGWTELVGPPLHVGPVGPPPPRRR